MAEILGADWVNLSLIRDLSTDQYMFEIHLVIDLADKPTADAIEQMLIDASDGDVNAPALKTKLRKLARADATHPPNQDAEHRRSRRQIINGIMVRQNKLQGSSGNDASSQASEKKKTNTKPRASKKSK